MGRDDICMSEEYWSVFRTAWDSCMLSVKEQNKEEQKVRQGDAAEMGNAVGN